MEYYTSCFGVDHMNHNFIGAGPHGPVVTIRLRLMREGLQEAEVRILAEDPHSRIKR